MPIPMQISFRGIAPSEFLEAEVRRCADALERFADRIVACKVMLEETHQRHRQGNVFHVRIDITVPGQQIVVSRDPSEHHAHEDMHVAIRDAFDAVRRQLEDHVRRQGGVTKTHKAQLTARVVTLMAEGDYGFIATEAGEAIYFHRNSVVNDGFNKLRVGDRVRYVLAQKPGENGPQASTVESMHAHA